MSIEVDDGVQSLLLTVLEGDLFPLVFSGVLNISASPMNYIQKNERVFWKKKKKSAQLAEPVTGFKNLTTYL